MVWINFVKAAASAVITAAPYVLKGAPIVWEGSPLVDGGLSKSIERGDEAGVALKVASVALGVAGTAALAFGLVSNPIGWGIVATSLAISLYDTWEDAKHNAREQLAKDKAANLPAHMQIKPSAYAAVDTNALEAKPDPAAQLTAPDAKEGGGVPAHTAPLNTGLASVEPVKVDTKTPAMKPA